MKLLVKNRGASKTTGLIYTSESTGYPIITSSKIRACYIKDQAKAMNCEIPEPLTVEDVRMNKVLKVGSNILFDDVETILEAAINQYLNSNVVCATMTNLWNIEETNEQTDEGDM